MKVWDCYFFSAFSEGSVKKLNEGQENMKRSEASKLNILLKFYLLEIKIGMPIRMNANYY